MKVGTPARDDSYADDTRAPLMQPARRGATHDKLTSNNPLCNGLRAFATCFSLCLSPASNGSNVPGTLMSFRLSAVNIAAPHSARSISVCLVGAVRGGIIRGSL